MANLILFGVPASSYVRTARMVCIEKNVPHTLEPVDFGGPQHEKVHPWRRVPAMHHGDVHLYETSAIIRYVDEIGTGPSLVPATPAARGRMEQVISAVNSYVYDSLIKKYALVYINAKDAPPDRAKLDAALPALKRDLAVLDAAHAGQPYAAGDTLSLADLLLAPIVQTVGMFPEGRAALDGAPNLVRVYDKVRARDSFAAVHANLFG